MGSLADVENELVDPVGEGEAGASARSSTDTCTPSRVKEIAGGKSPCNTGSPAQSAAVTQRGGPQAGRGGSGGKGYVYNHG